jgi:7-cyano-7-deazaguanine synthase in queuosine biosynthesis/intein/homing endonuclease
VKRAVVLLSGGLDSATTLAIARAEGFTCHALSVDYGQRHSVELAAASRVAKALGAHEHRIMRIDLAGIGGSALTDPSIAVPQKPTIGIPVTYVPARNTTLLSLALGWAEVLKAEAVFVGVNARDYSVSGESRVWIRDSTGARLMRFKDAYELPPGAYETIAVEPASLRLAWKPVLDRCKHRVTEKRCFRIRLERGQTIEVTEDHSLFTVNRAGDIEPIQGADIEAGTPLVVPFDLSELARTWIRDRSSIDLRSLGDAMSPEAQTKRATERDGSLTNRLRRTRIPLSFPITDDFLRIVGLWLAEGGKDPESEWTTLAFSIGGLGPAPDLLRRYFGAFGITVHKSPANSFDYQISSSVAYELFRRLDLFGTAKSAQKHFPVWFWSLSQRQRRIVVAGLWDGDGSQVWGGEASICQKSHELIEELYHCLLLDGIFPTLKDVAHSQKRLAISRAADMARFVALYPLWHDGKRQSLERAAAAAGREKTTGLWKCPGLWEAVAATDLTPGSKTRIYNAGGKYDVSVRAQRSAFALVPCLEQLAECKLAFLRVVSIEAVVHDYMYDFSVDGAENFLADGFLAHNSGYPDCRPEFIAAFDKLARLATRAGVEGQPTRIHAPLIQLSKADIVRRGTELGVDFGMTVSCYQPDSQGRACGRCDACRLRREGFRAAGIDDPTSYQ